MLSPRDFYLGRSETIAAFHRIDSTVLKGCCYELLSLLADCTDSRRHTSDPLNYQLRRRPARPPTSPFCYHQLSGSASAQVDNRRQPGFPRFESGRFARPCPDDVTSVESLSTLRQRLKSHFSPYLFFDYFLDCTLTNLHCVSKNIPDIFDCNFKNNHQILIIFYVNIPDTTCHQITI